MRLISIALSLFLLSASVGICFSFSIHGSAASRNNAQNQELEGVLTRCIIPGVVALTFDDGPFRYTHGVLDVLMEKEVTATFFVNGGNWMDISNETAQEMIRRSVAEGHTIGSHTWSHQNLSGASPEDIRNQMNLLTEALIGYELLETQPTFMRPPFGDYDEQVIEIVGGELGYRLVNWSITTRDWAHPGDTEAGVLAYREALNATDPATTLGFISLHHDVQVGSEELATAVIDFVRSQGYRFVSIEECLGNI